MKKWNFDGFKAEMKAWAAKAENRSFMHDNSLSTLEAVFISGGKDDLSVGRVLTSLGLLAGWYGTNGALKVLESDRSGWTLLQKATVLKAWRLQIYVDLFHSDHRKNKKGRVSARESALCLAQALVLGGNELAVWCGERLLNGQTNGSIRSWSATPFPAFTLDLFRLWRGDSPDSSTAAPYSGIISAIVVKSISEFTSSMLIACDYHLSRSMEGGDEETPEFSDYPYPVFPVEILATLRVAHNLGWEVSPPPHPLLQSPLSDPILPPLQSFDLHERLAAWWGVSPPIG